MEQDPVVEPGKLLLLKHVTPNHLPFPTDILPSHVLSAMISA